VKYRTIVADPPWAYEGFATTGGGGHRAGWDGPQVRGVQG
jgi:hypothetical protein